VRLWSAKSHEQIGEPLEHTTYVNCVAISPSGELLASGDFHGNIQLWPIENTLFAAFGMDFSFFVRRSNVKLGQSLYAEALLDANKVRTILDIILTLAMIFRRSLSSTLRLILDTN
jgi:WD40 repeat protein